MIFNILNMYFITATMGNNIHPKYIILIIILSKNLVLSFLIPYEFCKILFIKKSNRGNSNRSKNPVTIKDISAILNLGTLTIHLKNLVLNIVKHPTSLIFFNTNFFINVSFTSNFVAITPVEVRAANNCILILHLIL